MAEPTIDEMLLNVRTAINAAIVNGGTTRWSLNGREVEVDLGFLERTEKSLMARRSVETPGVSLRTLAEFGSRPS